MNLKVLKKLSPHHPGARKLALRYGKSLICVRHRTDATGRLRYTTVELLIDKTPIQPRGQRIVRVRLRFEEGKLRTVVKAAGGTWDAKAKLWLMPQRVASALNLLARVVPE